MENAIAARTQASSHGASAHIRESRYGGAILHGGTTPDAQPPRPADHLRAGQQRHRQEEECLALSTTVVLCTARREPCWMGGTRGSWKRMRRARVAANEEEAVWWHRPRDVRHRRCTGSPGSSCELHCVGVAGPHGQQAAPRGRSCMRATSSAMARAWERGSRELLRGHLQTPPLGRKLDKKGDISFRVPFQIRLKRIQWFQRV
jgi:hypothetical protein